MATEPLALGTYADQIDDLIDNVSSVIRGKQSVVEDVVTALLARGHILLEDVPGVGKTTLANALARSIEVDFQRVQFTSDLLPADIIGVTIFSQDRQEFEFVKGPVFTSVLLADEINRATPKTQSALLEAMSEGYVSVERERLMLPNPFLVIATQNPVEHVGTYPLPESQLDRFMMKLSIGYPDTSSEREVLRGGGGQHALESLEPVLSGEDVIELQGAVERVHVSESLLDYLMALVEATRTDSRLSIGVSTRGAIVFTRAAQARAMVRGRGYVIADDVKEIAVSVLGHRVMGSGGTLLSGPSSGSTQIIQTILDSVPVPR